MNTYQCLQSARIFSCYLEKGGIGSGRHKSSIQELEEVNFDPEVEKEQINRVNEISKLHFEINQLNWFVDKRKRSIKQQELLKLHINSNTRDYHIVEGRIKKYVREGKEFMRQINEKKTRIDELNH